MTTSDKLSVEDGINPVEAQDDAEFIVINSHNKEDIAELCLVFFTALRREVSNQQNEQINIGKSVLRSANKFRDHDLKLQADNILFQSTNNAKRYKELTKVIRKLEGEISVSDLTEIVDGLERY